MKKIAIFQNDLEFGGIQKSLINLLNLINYDNYSVDLYVFKKDCSWENKINPNVNLYFLEPMKSLYKYLPFEFAYTKSKYDFNHIEENYDLAIDFNSYQPWTAAAAITIPAEYRVMWVHNDIEIKYHEEWKYRVLFTFMKGKYQFFEKYAFVSKALVEPFQKLSGVSEKEYYIVPNTIDTDEIFSKCNQTCDDVIIDNEKINICAVGRLCHQKGYDIMLNEFSKAYKLNNNLRLYIIGDGPDYDVIEKQINDYELNNIVILLGSRDNPYCIMNRCDGFISTSRYEGQGMNIMEAKALGLQIVIPEHLEKYVEDIAGTANISLALSNITKTEKKFDNLSSYNNKILEIIDTLC